MLGLVLVRGGARGVLVRERKGCIGYIRGLSMELGAAALG
jgi:hypothetical protein